MTRTHLVLALATFLAVLVAGCGARRVRAVVAGELPPVTGLVAQGGGPPYVRAAVIRALQERRYTVAQESGQQIVAQYERGRHYLQVVITYDATAFHIQPLQALGLNERHYARYSSDLERTIQNELARPDREAHQRAMAAAQPRVVVVGGAVGGGGYVTSCEDVVRGYGQSGTIHCRPETDVHCADALLSMGHSTSALLFCNGVEPNCARQHLLSGGAPVALNRCRY